ncbi:12-oxophytodienoate reductase [Stipitochalara longipes BDJ]|nr:12-oxophytodienoate reductase [Stipitochalara longipes BDJ]
METNVLKAPFKLALHTLDHRVVLAPMTRMRASQDGIPHPRAAEYYAERTTPNSLLISEGIVIHPRGRGFPNTPGLYNDEQVQAWKPITQAVRGRGGVFFAQLWHVGRVAVPSQTGGLPPLSSTKLPLPGSHQLFGKNNGKESYVESQAMSEEDIKEVIQQFATAAKNAIEAGFDGIELHGGNGYLLDTFVHDNINDRTDAYGGCLENRLRFPLQIIDAIIAAIGRDRTAIRVAPFHILQQTLDSDRIATFKRYAEELEKRGLAYVHMVEPRYDQYSTEGAFSGKREVVDLGERTCRDEFSLWTFRRILKCTPLVGAGGYDANSARDAIAEGRRRVDLVAFGRYFTSTPDLPKRLFEGLPLTKYDRPTFYTPGMDGYLGWTTA